MIEINLLDKKALGLESFTDEQVEIFIERKKNGNRYHGMSNTKEYRHFYGIKQRCYSKSNKDYKNYGARGITICDRWLESFEYFLQDMGPRPEGYSIDRIDNSKGYSKENCKWATVKEQSNNKRTNKIIEFEGVKYTRQQLLEKFGLKKDTVKDRIRRGWDPIKACTTPNLGKSVNSQPQSKKLIIRNS